ncbi:Ig-like domain-containing protein [Flavobacterium sp. UBA6135]|uniref:Ig-like domain-containing protein n=1 Tax=Flavobacterium sp. UBA6135 TaxID=1946553 RepID=UPI0025C38D3F|nr:Ig-like domain-containing protein [Flavobacterium sp. UBA6135]
MRFLTILLFSLLITGCAKRGFITGGLKDTISPVLKISDPKNYSTHFDAKEIKLHFDEYIKLKDVNKQLIVSPLMKHAPTISPSFASKTITIKINDTLLPNTTYSLNFGKSIQDNNEGNPYQQFKYVFSTGSYIDSLTVVGSIKDAFYPNPDNFVSIHLYEYNEKFYDSIIYKENPRYITNTLDSASTFKLENLKEGKYILVALKDNNNNYKFDPKNDKIAFFSEPITVPENSFYEMELFQEELPFKAIRATQASGNKLIVGHEGKPKNVAVKLFNGTTELDTKISKVEGKDSLQIWYPMQKTDSLKLQLKSKNYEKDFMVKLKNMKVDTLSVGLQPTGSVNFRDTLSLKTSTPLSKWDETKIELRNKDSILIPVTTKYNAEKQFLQLLFKKEERENYKLTLLPNAVTDMFEKTNDSMSFKFNTRNISDYGNLTLKIVGAKSYPIIVQLTDNKGKTLAESYATNSDNVNFDLLQPNKFTVRIIYDNNKNGIWDTGSYLEKRQTEEVYYYPTSIEVRSNWDVEQTINVGG